MELIIFFLVILFYQPARYLYYKIVELLFWYRVNRQSKSPEGFRLKGDAKYYDELLLEHIPYYKKLTPVSKAKFLNRINRFIYSKKFIGREGFEVTLDTQVLISAAAIQLTFGLKDYYLASFNKIIIYPDAFYFRQTGQYHKGNTGTQDFINLSYKHFLEGYEDSTDRVNLGLHEMTHALEFSYLFGDNYDYLFADFYDNWTDIEELEFEKMNIEEGHFLRKYAKANIHEFFAVSVEHFFEDPQNFKDTAWELYYRLCALLNQDPLNVYGDYSLAKSSKEVHGIKRNYLNRSGHWSYTMMLTGLFLGSMLIYYLSQSIMIPVWKILLLILLSAITGGFLHYKYFKNNYWPGLIHFIAYNILGFGIWLTCLLLLGNRLIHVNKEDTSFYQVLEVKYERMDAHDVAVVACRITQQTLNELAVYYGENPSKKIDRKNLNLLFEVIPKELRKIDIHDCIEPQISVKYDKRIYDRVLLISRTRGLFGFYVVKRVAII